MSKLLETKVYVGVSAGSMITNPTLLLELSKKLYGEDLEREEEMSGLKLVDFYIVPHLNSIFFTNVVKKNIKSLGIKDKIYALDDNSAVIVDGEKVEVISEGKVLELN